jgi:hypothetical protein
MKITTALNRTRKIEIEDKTYTQHKLSLGALAAIGAALIDGGDAKIESLSIDEIINSLWDKNVYGLLNVAKSSTDMPDEIISELEIETLLELFEWALDLKKKESQEQAAAEIQ